MASDRKYTIRDLLLSGEKSKSSRKVHLSWYHTVCDLVGPTPLEPGE